MLFLLILAVLAYVAWPYYTLWRLDQALTKNDLDELVKQFDLTAIRHHLLQDGVKEGGAAALDAIDASWVRERLLTAQVIEAAPPRPVLGGFAFACFERPTRFLVRSGALGKNPVHLYLTLQGCQWRVTAVFV